MHKYECRQTCNHPSYIHKNKNINTHKLQMHVSITYITLCNHLASLGITWQHPRKLITICHPRDRCPGLLKGYARLLVKPSKVLLLASAPEGCVEGVLGVIDQACHYKLSTAAMYQHQPFCRRHKQQNRYNQQLV